MKAPVEILLRMVSDEGDDTVVPAPGLCQQDMWQLATYMLMWIRSLHLMKTTGFKRSTKRKTPLETPDFIKAIPGLEKLIIYENGHLDFNPDVTSDDRFEIIQDVWQCYIPRFRAFGIKAGRNDK